MGRANIGHALVVNTDCGLCGGRKPEVLRLDFWKHERWMDRLSLHRCSVCLNNPVTASDVDAASGLRGWV